MKTIVIAKLCVLPSRARLVWRTLRRVVVARIFRTGPEVGLAAFLAESLWLSDWVRLKKAAPVFFVLISVLAVSIHAQVPPSNAEREWPTFWKTFKVAINAKDKARLQKMMPDDFFDGGGGMTAAEWLQYIDENDRKGSWRDLRRSMAKGTRASKRQEKLPTRITVDNYYYFEFRKGRWWFAGVVGD